MATYMLIHGGFAGGWIWDAVAPLLEAAGHTVYAPTLTGLGERTELPCAHITLDTHAQDVIDLINCERLSNIILVGHSYSGMVITAVAERTPERIGHLIYLDAFVPEDGHSLVDYLPAAVAEELTRLAAERGGWAPMPFSPESLGLTNEADIQRFLSRVVDHPIQTALDRVEVRSPAAAKIPRTFIYCTSPALGFFDEAAARAQQRGWRFRELATGHLPQITAPGDVAHLLLEAAT